MFLSELVLKNFRSYKKHTFSFSPITIIIGPNTAGKTNVLEAIFLSSNGKSFRAEHESDMLAWSEEVARIQTHVKVKGEELKLEVVLTPGEVGGQKAPHKRFLVNGVGKRQIDFVGNLFTVLFWPEDLDLVTGSPSLRRRYLDFILCQVDREYRRSLLSYEKGVRQRNRLLERIRDGEASRSQLMFWDQLLIKTGNYLTNRRQDLIDYINNSPKPFGEFTIVYDHSYISEMRLAQYADAEVGAAVTLVGPHRDELKFLEKERVLSSFGSRGEQRLCVLWLKLAELKFITAEVEEKPVLLLDDIFSELDHMHREEVLKIVGEQQTIITTTDEHFVPNKLRKQAKMIELKK